MPRTKLVEDPEQVDVSGLPLKHMLSFTIEDAITFLINTNFEEICRRVVENVSLILWNIWMRVVKVLY